MAYLTVCNACQDGDHKNHYRVVQAVPKGMYGGAVCKCNGECKDGRYKPKPPAWMDKMVKLMNQLSS